MTSLPPDAAGGDDAVPPAGPTDPAPRPSPTAPTVPAPTDQPAGLPARSPAPPPAQPARDWPARDRPVSRPERPTSRPASRLEGLEGPALRPSGALVELTLDLRATPPDKVLNRLFGALQRVGADVTLLVLLRDTPEYAGVVASAYQALRSRGYVSDSSRFPAGGQRLRVRRRIGDDRAAGSAGSPDGTAPSDGAVEGEG